jgi:hypothetical protein
LIPTQHEYEQREAQEFGRQLNEAERNPARRADCEELRQLLATDPALVAERIGWLLDGSYGFGAAAAAERELANRRANRVAWLVQTIGALEWRCRRASVIAAWKRLAPTEKRALGAAVTRVIKDHEAATR